MARNRQKAKERQARRKAQGRPDDAAGTPRPSQAESPPKPPRAQSPPEATGDNGRDEGAVVDPGIVAGAPVARSDELVEHESDVDPPSPEVAPAEDAAEEDVAAGARGHAATAERHKHRPRFVQFLFAVWAELQRVQWPDRQALTTLTGVVLAFVLIAGGYLGFLDAIFSRLIQEIL